MVLDNAIKCSGKSDNKCQTIRGKLRYWLDWKFMKNSKFPWYWLLSVGLMNVNVTQFPMCFSEEVKMEQSEESATDLQTLTYHS